MILKVDDLIIDKVFQPLSDIIFEKYDRTCFWVGSQIAMASIALHLIDAGLLLMKLANASFTPASFIGACGCVLVAIVLPIQIKQTLREEEKALESEMYFSDLRIQYSLIRILFLVLSVIMTPGYILLFVSGHADAHDLVRFLELYTLLSIYYFWACQVRPKKRHTKTKFAFST